MRYLSPVDQQFTDPRESWRRRYREAYRNLRECRNHLARYNEGEAPGGIAESPAHAPSANPELLIVSNPGERFGSADSRPLIVRHKGGKGMRRRRKGKNAPLTVKIGGKRYTFRSFLRKLKKPLKKALRIWRKKKKYHGWSKTRVAHNRRRRRGHRRSRKCNYRRKHRRGRRGRK